MKKKDVLTDDILKKSHRHKEKEFTPEVCPNCEGRGYVRKQICEMCIGEGVVIGGSWANK